jgi:hypothetical protein
VSGQAHRHIHGDDASPIAPRITADRVRSFAEMNAVLEADPTAEPWPMILRVLALEVRRTRARMPTSVNGLLRLLHRRLVLEQDVWVPRAIVELGASGGRFADLWRLVRLNCERCDGYLVVRWRNDRAFRIAGCSNWNANGCRFTLGSKPYVRRKADVVLALLAGDEPEAPHFVLSQPMRPERRAERRAVPAGISRSLPSARVPAPAGVGR